jgi:hypothetical protein
MSMDDVTDVDPFVEDVDDADCSICVRNAFSVDELILSLP